METKYITVKTGPDKNQIRPTRRRSFLLDCALFGAGVIGMYVVVCAVLVIGRMI